MTDIRRIADPISQKYYYPQTHYLAVKGLTGFVDKRIDEKSNYAKYIEDFELLNNSGLFYFDKNTKNKPAGIESGYLQAMFKDSKNGVIEVATTNKYLEVADGQLSDLKERS